jgi:hypothetical protein
MPAGWQFSSPYRYSSLLPASRATQHIRKRTIEPSNQFSTGNSFAGQEAFQDSEQQLLVMYNAWSLSRLPRRAIWTACLLRCTSRLTDGVESLRHTHDSQSTTHSLEVCRTKTVHYCLDSDGKIRHNYRAEHLQAPPKRTHCHLTFQCVYLV